MGLVERLVAGDTRALARGISRIEEGVNGADALMRAVFPHTGCATVLGVTGAPGAGKSSLVDRLIGSFRATGRRVGVVAIDPSSAYSGGAILGDRVRMQDHANDDAVFIRSMATRGHLGGLSRATNDAVDLMDAAGFDPIVIETVGVGQDEIDIVRAADVVSVILVPGMGDDIQAIKAGILEIADVFVINKADRAGADRLIADLDTMLSLVGGEQVERPEILTTIAVRGEGVEPWREAIERFVERSAGRRAARRRERAAARFRAVLGERLMSMLVERADGGATLERLIDEIAERRTDPYSAAETVLNRVEVRA